MWCSSICTDHACSTRDLRKSIQIDRNRILQPRLWKQFCDAFNCMSVCALIDEKIICMHGYLVETPRCNAAMQQCSNAAVSLSLLAVRLPGQLKGGLSPEITTPDQIKRLVRLVFQLLESLEYTIENCLNHLQSFAFAYICVNLWPRNDTECPHNDKTICRISYDVRWDAFDCFCSNFEADWCAWHWSDLWSPVGRPR